MYDENRQPIGSIQFLPDNAEELLKNLMPLTETEISCSVNINAGSCGTNSDIKDELSKMRVLLEILQKIIDELRISFNELSDRY